MTQAPSARMFQDVVTIERATVALDELGGEEETWEPVFTDVPCQFAAFAPGSSARMIGELREPHDVYVESEARMILSGDLDVRTTDRAVLPRLDRTFDIRGVERDSFQLVTTLRVDWSGP